VVSGPSHPQDTWLPPRGPRNPDTGGWLFSLSSRPDGSYGSGFERAAVGNFRQIIDALVLARLEGGLSVRELARASGVGTTTVSDLLTGAVWGRWRSFLAVASTLGQVLTVAGDRDVLGSLTLAARRRPQSMSRRQFADYASLRPNTLYELHRTVAPSCATVFAVATALRMPIEVSPSE
jgi:DNA-binding phage protein